MSEWIAYGIIAVPLLCAVLALIAGRNDSLGGEG